MKPKKKFILPCADDDGTPMCFMCREYFPSIKSLYHHMKRHSNSDWREILPLEPENSTVIACYTLLSVLDSYQFDNDEKGCDHRSEEVPMMEEFPRWTMIGKRGRPARDSTVAKGGTSVAIDDGKKASS